MIAFKDLYRIDRYIDTRALGFSARVSQATYCPDGQEVAFKVMRREHQGDGRVWEQFATEVELLSRFRLNSIPARLIDCGFVSDQSHECPAGGNVISCGSEAAAFQAELKGRLATLAWRPYLSLERLQPDGCLLSLVRGVDGDGRRPLRLTTEEALSLAIQFAEFLCQVHAGNVVYWDHKPEHVYWANQQLRIIDFNVSRLLDTESSESVRAYAKGKDIHHMLSGVLYTAFTGRDFRFKDQAPQPTPSAPKMVEVRFNGTNALDFSLEDTLLPSINRELNRLMGVPPASLRADDLLDCLKKIAAEIGWETGYPATEPARLARAEIQQGLTALRQAQADLDKARQHFLQAQALNPDDRESERLYREASEFYRQRVLP